jgi:hypothetical protein
MAVATVNDYVKKLPAEQASIVTALRQVVVAAAPAATETIKWAQPVYELNGPMIFIKAHARHVNIGFWRGAQLPDPSKLLEGSGDKMRHVKITHAAAIDAKALTRLIKAAVRLNRELGDPTRSR